MAADGEKMNNELIVNLTVTLREALAEMERLRAENARLLAENARLLAAIDEDDADRASAENDRLIEEKSWAPTLWIDEDE